MNLELYYFVIFCAVAALVYGAILGSSVLSKGTGSEAMQRIARAIQDGASAYLNRQYRVIAIVGLVVFVLLSWKLGLLVGVGFAIGSILSGAAGYIGMNISVRGNVRTAEAAKYGLSPALGVAFKSGAITGFLVVGLALLGITLYYMFLKSMGVEQRQIFEALVALSFGASLISIFARLGGGIFTKGADVGADLVGKVEAGIPEDDPRNPAVISDNVGDNVGDCAGMAADLFETYVVTIVGTMLLGKIFFKGADQETLIFLPLAICAISILASIVGSFFVRLGKKQNIMGALYKGFIASAILSTVAIGYLISSWFGFDRVFQTSGITFTGQNLFLCAFIGMVVTGLLMWITEYYTSTKFRPVRHIARASVTGHGTNVIQGLAVSLESTVLPVVFISGGILASYMHAGLYGVATAASSMLALAGMIVALDAYGPVTDNAGGIAEMSNLPHEVRTVTDALDAIGNTTKAVTKGYAIASAAFAALVLFAAYIEDLVFYFPNLKVQFLLQDPYVVIGLLIGGFLPYLFGALSMTSVGRAASAVVIEVRRQFKEIPGIMSGAALPDYKKAVDMLTKAAIREMIIPSLLPVVAPIALYFCISSIAGRQEALVSVGAMLLGVVLTGLFQALSMTGGGGAWDNAKKYIEMGNYGGKGSDAHKAAITGDTVGDPYKDTTGPAINPMIKIVNIVALLLLAILSQL
ncbi:MAG: sodium-translocating pyrophosphatase [Parachlamydiales bacterium]|nr:sodium-translocating pyrophosphatase [Parachlamydiales bacterium]